jgi:hypothetical protein
MKPEAGASISALVLSVSISTMGWPAFTCSPSATSHPTMTPVSIWSDIFGM